MPGQNEVQMVMKVRVNGKLSAVTFNRPLHLSGDSRRHKAQLRQVAEEGIAAVLTVLGGQFAE